MRGGFTLVEVIVALLILEVGILGVVGTLLLSSRTLARAEAVERGVLGAERVFDSLRGGAAPPTGSWTDGEGTATWTTSGADSVRIRYRSQRFGVVVDVAGVTSPDTRDIP